MKPAASKRPAMVLGDAAMASGDLAVVETALARAAKARIEPPVRKAARGEAGLGHA
jgi:hypothetical protein